MKRVKAGAGNAPKLEALVGPLEARVLRCLWDADRSLSVRDVSNLLHTHHAYNTVMTVLARLYQKGHLTREPAGQAFLYSPRLSEPEFVADLAGREVDALLERYGNVALAHFLDRVERRD